jgi:bidirectional [NiFe] hydrogenase diaphorase subunit
MRTDDPRLHILRVLASRIERSNPQHHENSDSTLWPRLCSGTPTEGHMQASTTKDADAAAAPKPSPVADKRFKMLEATVKKQQARADALIEVLHQAQELFGYLDTSVLLYVSRALRIPSARVYGVATFYNFFTLKPAGEHTCVVCLGTACYVKGAGPILNALEAAHRVHAGQTTPDGRLSLVTARCLGACGLAPAVVFDGDVAGRVAVDAALRRTRQWMEAP